jgi:hypothetical protein
VIFCFFGKKTKKKKKKTFFTIISLTKHPYLSTLPATLASLCEIYASYLVNDGTLSRIGSGKYLLHSFAERAAAAVDDEALFRANTEFLSSYDVIDGRRSFSPTHATGTGPNCMRCTDGVVCVCCVFFFFFFFFCFVL